MGRISHAAPRATLCNKLIFSNNLCDLSMAVYLHGGTQRGNSS